MFIDVSGFNVNAQMASKIVFIDVSGFNVNTQMLTTDRSCPLAVAPGRVWPLLPAHRRSRTSPAAPARSRLDSSCSLFVFVSILGGPGLVKHVTSVGAREAHQVAVTVLAAFEPFRTV